MRDTGYGIRDTRSSCYLGSRISYLVSVLPQPSSSLVFPQLPPMLRNVLLGDVNGLLFQRRRHGVVEAVHEAEVRDQARDLDDRPFRPVLSHPVEQLVGDVV